MTRFRDMIVLDRDGVVNEDSDAFIKHPDEWRAIPRSLEAIVRLKQAGFYVALATNQSGIRRGYYDRATFYAMQQKLQRLLCAQDSVASVDWVGFSPYLGEDASPARKPGVGMLQAIELAAGRALAGRAFVGDSLGDIQAAQRFGMRPILVRTGKGERTLKTGDPALASVPVYADLFEAVDALLAEPGS
ncbi:MAG: HAD-IIIA family hydrolase [Hydrogenovibrio sp.]|uniref:HAD-IIIA family hydrolase n=1 Tax=Hydrogenovibrio sp. TaxID=2065821 RepID=UPI0028700F4D|nr:HAD-IIIA family hydrolase [Hydrogenovibrio sp.]MDR9498861.1 HAD-IIIA family hydrolase [Hydrogenovibrio sp.]